MRARALYSFHLKLRLSFRGYRQRALRHATSGDEGQADQRRDNRVDGCDHPVTSRRTHYHNRETCQAHPSSNFANQSQLATPGKACGSQLTGRINRRVEFLEECLDALSLLASWVEQQNRDKKRYGGRDCRNADQVSLV